MSAKRTVKRGATPSRAASPSRAVTSSRGGAPSHAATAIATPSRAATPSRSAPATRAATAGAPAARGRTPAAAGYRMPGEWEPHAATWLAWPHEKSDWPGKFDAVPWVFAEMARQLQHGERIRLIVSDAKEQRRVGKKLSDAGVDLGRVDFFVVPTDRSWTRDFLPLFVVREPSGKRGVGEVGAVKWQFNGWARYDNFQKDDEAGASIPERLGVRSWLPSVGVRGRSRRVVLEGGAVDVDGEGTMLATEQCLLSGPQARNAELGKEGVERAVRDYLGVERLLWLGEGIEGDDTSGHIDDFARFVAPGKIVLCEERNPADANHRLLNEAFERLQGQRDARGRRVEVVRLPMPSPVAFAGQRLPASYANFYIGNEVVLVPTFNDPMDRVALGLLAELLPGRRVVGIHCLDLVLGLGTLHCSTQQEPAAPGLRAESAPTGERTKPSARAQRRRS